MRSFVLCFSTFLVGLLCFSTFLVRFLSLPFPTTKLGLLQSLLKSHSLVEQRSGTKTDAPDIPAVPDAPETWPEALSPAPPRLDPSCEISSRSLDWGWEEVCHLTHGGDEACEMFLASKMYQDERIFVETARRSTDSTYHPNLARLKARVVQAVSEGRPVKIVGMGPSTTKGVGCPNQHLRWTDSLQNLSSFRGSPLPLEVINEARPATRLQLKWRQVLQKYQNDRTLDIVVIDYSVTANDASDAKSGATTIYAYLQDWKRPPALLFVETFSRPVMHLLMLHGSTPCGLVANFTSSDPFYGAAKAFRLPLLNYPGMVCQMPPLNRSTRSINKMPFLHAYDDVRSNAPVHYGCGVHFILAHTVHRYLLQVLQESCDVGSQKVCTGTLKDFCEKGFQETLEEEKMQKDLVVNLSKAERCEMHITTYLSHLSDTGFPAFVSANSSKWRLGADRPGKYGWIANEEPQIPLVPKVNKVHRRWPTLKQYGRYAELKPGEIVFLVRLTGGLIFLEYLSSYENIGSATCQLEDMEQNPLGAAVKIDALWSEKVSITTRVTLEAEKIPRLRRGFNAAVRCTEDGKKFKLLGIASC